MEAFQEARNGSAGRRFQGNADSPSALIRFFRGAPPLFLAAALALAAAGCGEESPTSGTSPGVFFAASAGTAAEAFTVLDLAGHRVDPFAEESAKAIVLIFVGLECPISNRYAPELRRLDEQFSSVQFWLVYADPDASPDAIEKHLKDYKLPRKVLRDPRHDLVRLSQVRVTPEAAVFLPGRRLAYHGRIDNRYVELGRERPEATQHDLQNVLEAIRQGKPVPYATAKAVGCYIPDIK